MVYAEYAGQIHRAEHIAYDSIAMEDTTEQRGGFYGPRGRYH